VPKDLSQNLAAMKVHDLLTMSCGHEVEPKMKESPNWAEAFLIHEVPHRPGTFFRYNSAGSHMLSIILGKATGEKLSEYLKPRLFEPLGIEEFQWEESPQGDTIGGWGLHLRTEDIAKFGQLYLQQGKWEGKQLLSPDWIAMATSKQVENDQAPSARGKSDWAQGYGFQFWRCRHGAYRGDGRDGQFCIVLPEQDAVVAITAKTGNMQDELNVVWDKLVPAFQSGTLPDNPKEQERLRLILAGLKAK
jgi:CubicO group peptidase (beta-lactamase class C family)